MALQRQVSFLLRVADLPSVPGRLKRFDCRLPFLDGANYVDRANRLDFRNMNSERQISKSFSRLESRLQLTLKHMDVVNASLLDDIDSKKIDSALARFATKRNFEQVF